MMLLLYAVGFAFLGYVALILLSALGNAGLLIGGILAFGVLCAAFLWLWNKLLDIEQKVNKVLKLLEEKENTDHEQ